MTPFASIARLARGAAGFCAAVLLAGGLAGCVSSDKPLLSGGDKLFGETSRVQTYGLRDRAAHDPSLAEFRWDNGLYIATNGSDPDKVRLSFHRLGGDDFIVQASDERGDRAVEYALAREIAEGVLLIAPLDEDLVDAEVRAAHCPQGRGCKVSTAEALRALAAAQAARPFRRGALAIRLAPDGQK